jgi:hypothetical protein
MEQFIEVAKTIGIALGEIIITVYVCMNYVKKNLKKPDISSKLPKQNSIDLEITNKMDYAKEILNADRIHLYEFHNGEHYSDWRSAYKFSCSYEVTKAGTQSMRSKCTGLPISIMPRFIHKITTEGKFICDNIENIKNDMVSTYEFKKNIGIKSFYDVAIRNKLGNVIGFIAIQWDKNTKANIDEDEIKKLVWFVEERILKSIELSTNK